MFYTKDRMCFELLRALYHHANQYPEQPFSEAELEGEFAVSPVQFDLVVDWLVEAGLARIAGPDGTLAITDRGREEMEARGMRWRLEADAITDWLAEEKQRIVAERLPPSQEIARKKGAVMEARERRLGLEARLRDLRVPMEDLPEPDVG